MATVTITLVDEGEDYVVSAEFDPAPDKNDVISHSPKLTTAQHVAVHLMEMLEAANGSETIEGPRGASGTVLVQRDDPRYKL